MTEKSIFYVDAILKISIIGHDRYFQDRVNIEDRFLRHICDAFPDLVPFAATLLKVTFLRWCFSHF